VQSADMKDDVRITSQPRPAEAAANELPDLPSLARPQQPMWTHGQVAFVVSQFLVLLGILIFLICTNYGYAQLLWTHPTGIKMTPVGCALVLLGGVIYLAIMFGLNRALLDQDGRRGIHLALSILVNALYLLLCFFPAAFVVLVGPASVQIMDNLLP